MPNQILTLGALAGAPQPAYPKRRNMTPGEQRALWSQGSQGMGPQVLPVNLWDLAVNNPVSQYLGEVIGKGAEKVSEYLPENWRQQAMLTLPLLVGAVGMGKGAKGPKGTLPELTQNVRRPLSEYTPKLYREMDPKSAAGLMGTAESIGGPGMIHASNVPELALGQGANRGVLVEFDSSGLEGQVNTRKPGWEPSWQKGAAEFEIHDASQPVLRDAVRSVTISAEALAGKAQKQARLLRDYRLTGWEAQKNPDGSITYTRPKK